MNTLPSMSTHHLLMIEDDTRLAQMVGDYLGNNGLQVTHMGDARSGLEQLQPADGVAGADLPDLVILDLMLPDMDGLEVCRRIRRESAVPLIMLTARVEEADTLIGLELGADDYIAKPFRAREVVARARALLRRASGALGPGGGPLRGAGIVLDPERRSVEAHGRPVELTPTEFALLAALMRNAGRPLSRSQLLDAAQGDVFEGYERTIDAHIKNLRRKIEPDSAQPQYIITIYGVGYKFAEPT